MQGKSFLEARFSRRQLLQAAGSAAALYGLGASPIKAWASTLDYPIRVDGEDNKVGHLLRDGHHFPIPAPSRKVDVAVVGGGVSGLVAAYRLRDLDVQLLEKETKTGGHARAGNWKGITYSEGAAYVSDTSGFVGDLIRELKIPLLEIGEPGDAYRVGSEFVQDFWGNGADRLPIRSADKAGFKRFMADVSAMKDLPPLPVETATAAALKFDTIAFSAFARPYGPEVCRYLDLYCRSALGGGLDDVSAYWGINFLSGEFSTRYTAPGGNVVFADILAAAVGRDRLLTGATVIRIEPKGDQTWVTYVLASGECVTLAARAVVVATAKQIAKYLVVGLPADQYAAMASMRYEPYVVTNVLLNDRCPRDGYDIWCNASPYTDFIVADWVNPDPHRQVSVLTAYCPVPEKRRALLLDDAQVEVLAHSVIMAMDRAYPGLAKKVVEVRTYRRGHPMVLSSPGAVTRIRPLATRPLGSIFFAASDSQMTPTIEAAIWEGLSSAKRAKQALTLGRALLAT